MEHTRPDWLGAIAAHRRSGAAHAFVLHFNTRDYVFDGTHPPRQLRDYLVRYLQGIECRRIGIVSVAHGLRWTQAPARTAEPTRTQGEGPTPPPLPAETQRDLNRLSSRAGTDIIQELRQLSRELRRPEEGRVGVLIENLGRIAPATASDRESMVVSEILEELFSDLNLRASGVIILATCRSLEGVAPDLVNGAGAKDILVPLPGKPTRQAFLRYLAAGASVGLASLEPDLTIDGLVNMSQGLSIKALDELNRGCVASSTPISSNLVRAAKQEAIEKQSGGMLEEVKPRHGFDTIGGLEHVVAYLRKVVEDVRRGAHQEAPKGILLSGPPGTGKTLLAEALAREAGFNLVKMGDIRSKWVGESERNLTNVLRLLTELEPVVVFIDEIDTALGAGARGNSGDSGVSSRILGRILNFMGQNENRGKVLWIAATNRPDLLDDAMISRFNRIFPVLMPGPAEREQILGVMPTITDVRLDKDVRLNELARATQGLTGRAIETVVRRAREMQGRADGITHGTLEDACRDYKPNHDPDMYELQSLLALEAANFWSALPSDESLDPAVRDVVIKSRTSGSAAELRARIDDLRARLRLARSG